MLKSHEKFHSANGKRQVLIADDELINREILGEILKNDYDLLFAADGQETLDMIRKQPDAFPGALRYYDADPFRTGRIKSNEGRSGHFRNSGHCHDGGKGRRGRKPAARRDRLYSETLSGC